MKTSQAGLKFISVHEGIRLQPYKDPVGLWTIGIGHLITPPENKTGLINIRGQYYKWRLGLSDKQVFWLLEQDVEKAEDVINTVVKAPLTQNQFDALVSFVFNVGGGAFINSTLLKKLNAKNNTVKQEFGKWVKGRVNGKMVALPGLVTRRKEEAKLFGS